MKKLFVALVLAGLLAACGGTSITDQADTGDESGGAGEAAAAKTASVGDSITLKGNEDGLEMKVTVMKVDESPPKPEYGIAKKSEKYVAVMVSLENVGTAPYSDSPSNGAVLLDADSVGYDATLDEIKPSLGAPKIAPGDKRVGNITFVVPKGAKLDTFQFTLDSGFGPETGEWSL